MSTFVDSEFPHNDRSLYATGRPAADATPVTSWRRPADFAEQTPSMFVDGSSAGDVKQGALGTCWFLGALSVVATRDDLLRQLFVEHDLDAGKVVVRFWKAAKWVNVTIDDYVPCGKNGLPVYARSADLHECWVMLLEKAYAKLHGSFSQIEGGSVSEGLVDLTGGAPEEVDLDSDEGKAMYASGAFWQRLLYYKREEWLMGCSKSVEGGDVEADTGRGILQNHAYGLMDALTTSTGVKLLKLRNPWGEKEWTGAWSDGSAEWTDALKRELNVTFGNDGVFYMELSDFVAEFNKVYVVRLYEDEFGKKWQHVSVRGEWLAGKNAGGSINYDSWVRSPQYHIKVTRPDTDLYIVLGQPDVRLPSTTTGGAHAAAPLSSNAANNYTTKIGFYVLKADDDQLKVNKTLTEDDVVAKMTYLNMRQVAMDVKLEPGADYVIMCSTFEPDCDMPYTLDVFADEPIALKELPEPNESRADAEWRGATAGGCVNHPATWKNNPMLHFALSAPARLQVTLEQLLDDDDKPPHYAGMMLFKAASAKRLLAPDADVVWKTDITNARKVSGVAELAAHAHYVLVPNTFDPGCEGAFRVTLGGAGAVPPLTACDAWAESMVAGSWRGMSAGGCPNHATWRNNTQYTLTLPDGARSADISLTLTATNGAATEKHVGVYVLKGATGQRVVTLDESQLAAKSQFIPGTVNVKATLNAADGPFTLLPFTFDQGVEGQFSLKAFSDGAPPTIAPIDANTNVIETFEGSWGGASAGGCTNHETWPNNPKFSLRVRGGGGGADGVTVTLVLTQPPEPGVVGFGCMLLKPGDTYTLDSIIDEAPLVQHTFVQHTFTLQSGEEYELSPCTFDAGVARTFKGYLYAGVPLSVKAK